MKKKNMIMVGLLVLVCVLFLAVGYAGITKKLSLTASIGGKANPDNFKIGLADLDEMKDNDLSIITFPDEKGNEQWYKIEGSSAEAFHYSIDANDAVDESGYLYGKMTFIDLPGMSDKGDYALYYVPVVNVSNDLKATNFKTEIKFAGADTDKDMCDSFYSFTAELLKHSGSGNFTKENSYVSVTNTDSLLPYVNFADARTALSKRNPESMFLLKVKMETIHTLTEDTGSDGSLEEVFAAVGEGTPNLCKWTVDVTAEATANVD